MLRPLLCLTLFTLAMGAAACADESAAPLTAPEGALLAATNAPGLCAYEGSADYLIQLRIKDYCPASILEQLKDEDGVTVQEDVFWLAGEEDGGENADDFETAETVVSVQDDGSKECSVPTGRLGKRIKFTVPSHVECPRRYRTIPIK
jgi:hypothetical protein